MQDSWPADSQQGEYEREQRLGHRPRTANRSEVSEKSNGLRLLLPFSQKEVCVHSLK